MKENKLNFDWTKFIIGLLSALMGAFSASAAVVYAPKLIAAL